MAPNSDADDARESMRGGSTYGAPSSTMRREDQGDDVEALFQYLKRFGYFPNEALRADNLLFRPAVPFEPEDPTVYDERMEEAVRKFQQQQGLEVTGAVDETTLDLMKQPRCGFPDQPISGEGGVVADFVAQGNKWSDNNVSYHFDGYTPDLSQADQRTAIRGAFDRWAAVTPLNFTENPTTGDMRIGWYSGDHADGSPFDGASGVLAHCFYPPPNGGDIAGDCHFDEAETWSVNTPPSGIDLPTVALHELGHGIGLAHSNVSSAVMYAYYGGPRRELTTDDIQGIQSIYGAKFRWASRGGVIFEPVVGNDQDGRLEVFARGTDGALWHIWQTAPNNGWSGWASRGGIIQGPIALGRNADGRLEVFVRGGDNALWHKWQTAPNNGWSGWASLGGGMGSRVGITNNADGRLEVFVRGTDGVLYHIWQTAPNNGWSGWGSLGGVIQGAPSAARNADGRIEVFAKGMDNALYHIWQTAPNNGWSGWGSLGGLISNPVAINNADGRLEVFVQGADTGLWHIWQTAPNNGWSGWSSLSGQMTEGPIGSRNQDGRLELFVKGLDGALWHTWQSAPNNGWT